MNVHAASTAADGATGDDLGHGGLMLGGGKGGGGPGGSSSPG